MIKVVLVGFGNVGQHLYRAMHAASEIEVVQVYNRTTIKDVTINQTQNLAEIVPADVIIIAVPDDVINEVSAQLSISNTLVVHTSGGAAMQILADQNRKGVFYPLQTFSQNRNLAFEHIPICIEAQNDSDLNTLKKLGEVLSTHVVEVSSEKRSALHVAAVFVNNFSNHMYTIASEISEANQIDFNLLKPLLAETAQKIEDMAPTDAQTGPAKRSDYNTINKHMSLLQHEAHKAIYTQLTQAIMRHYMNNDKKDTHGKKL